MRRLAVTLCGLVVLLGPVRAGAQQNRVVADVWEAAFLNGNRAGYVRTTTLELGKDGRKFLQTTQQLNLTVRRFDSAIQLRMDTGTIEDERGKVVSVFTRHYLAQKKQLEITGTVEGKTLRLVRDGSQPLKPAPWDDRVLGMQAQENLLKDRTVKRGDRFSYRSFEPSINLVVTLTVDVQDYEEVELLGKRKQKLLRVEVTPDKIQGVQLPSRTLWVDDDYVTLRSEADAPGLGRIALFRADQKTALERTDLAKVPNIGTGHYLGLNRRILRPHETNGAVFRITVKGDDDPGTAFARDERQQVRNVKGNTFELHVRSSRGLKALTKAEDPGAEFTESSYFITSADPRVRMYARQAAGKETDPWRKALRIERWVNDHMTVRSDEAFATADHVARTLQGDCTEFAMLTAAMCRAEGIPARTALGLVYADVEKGPVLAFHMWTEVWAGGRWVPIDATLGRGAVGATHLKITDHSWHEERSLTPMLPLLRLLGRLSVEVVSVN